MIVYKLKFVGDGEFIIISPPILRRLIEKVKKSSEKDLTVEFDHLFPRPYQEYLLNVINSNSDEPYFSYEYIPKVLLDQNDLFKIAEHQLEEMKIEDVNCFDTVRLLKKRGNVLEMNCSNSFWTACKNSEACFSTAIRTLFKRDQILFREGKFFYLYKACRIGNLKSEKKMF